MQAIITKYLCATNSRGSRIKASCERGSTTISYPDELSGDAVHIAAKEALVAKFVKEDAKRYGTERNPWTRPTVCGWITSGQCAHVFVETFPRHAFVEFKDEEDRKTFDNYCGRAKVSEGTVAPLWNGLVCSALKRATLH